MKVRGTVLSIESVGFGSAARVQATCKFAKHMKWEPPHVVTFYVPLWTAKTYHVGKKVTMDIATTS